jgi:hypothetical protein
MTDNEFLLKAINEAVLILEEERLKNPEATIKTADQGMATASPPPQASV